MTEDQLTRDDLHTIAVALEVFQLEYYGADRENDADNWKTFDALQKKVARLIDRAGEWK